jgi:hypothetical protein
MKVRRSTRSARSKKGLAPESSQASETPSDNTSETTLEGSVEPQTPDEPQEKEEIKHKKRNRELEQLTQWGDWMIEQAELKAARARENNLLKKIEEENLREERERKKRRLMREQREQELRRLAQIKAEEEKKRREEERLAQKLEREAQRLQKKEHKERQLQTFLERQNEEEEEEEDLEENILETRAAQRQTLELVDGYRPFMAQWRTDVEIPIWPTFFRPEIYKSKTSEVTEMEFKSAADVVNEKLKKYKDYKGLEPRTISMKTPVFPRITEEYFLKESRDFYLDPLEEIGRLMETFALTYIPEEHKLKLYNPHAPYESLAGRYSTALYSRDYDAMFETIHEFNQFLSDLQESGAIVKHLREKRTFSRMALHEILNQIYSRSVSPEVHTLKVYRAFSNNVYGELLPKFCSMVFDQCGMSEKSCFIDLGSGVGNVTIQAALEYGCESYGCEIMENCSTLAELQETAFKERSALFGLQPGKVGFFHRQSFVGNVKVKSVIDRCDIILVNNFLFTPELNKETLQLFLDVKVGTKIISLKKVIPEARYHDLDDEFLSMFLVEKHTFGSGCVSWTDAPGVYYITTFTGEVSAERRRQLNKLHNTRRNEQEFLKRSASVRLSNSPPTEEKAEGFENEVEQQEVEKVVKHQSK